MSPDALAAVEMAEAGPPEGDKRGSLSDIFQSFFFVFFL